METYRTQHAEPLFRNHRISAFFKWNRCRSRGRSSPNSMNSMGRQYGFATPNTCFMLKRLYQYSIGIRYRRRGRSV